MTRILIYCEKDSYRLRYTLDILLVQLSGLVYSLTHDPEQFRESNDLKINYSNQFFADILQVKPIGLLFEKGVRFFEPDPGNWEGIPVIFSNTGTEGIPFDIFAASFFMLSRYEEYLAVERDNHMRFCSESSVAFKFGFLEEPVVQQWCRLLLKKLGLSLKQGFRFEPTLDIDTSYAFRHRPWHRILGGTLRNLLFLRWSFFIKRFQVLWFGVRDPFDTYDYIHNIYHMYEFQPVVFYLSGKYGQYDKNINPDHPATKPLLDYLNQKFQVGIHPSYQAFDNPLKAQSEVNWLSETINKPILRSRQHFLRLKLPDTYQMLLSSGIRDDYSMGFHDRPGFRSGICVPYPFYDLEKEEVTELIIHPLIIMDRTLKDRLNLSPEKAWDKIKALMEKVEAVNGCFISLWHNDALGNFGEWKGWAPVHEKMVALAKEKELFNSFK